MSSHTCSACGGTISHLPFTPGPGQNVYHRECMIYDRDQAFALGENDYYDHNGQSVNEDRVHKSAKSAYRDGFHGARRNQVARDRAWEEMERAERRKPVFRSKDGRIY